MSKNEIQPHYLSIWHICNNEMNSIIKVVVLCECLTHLPFMDASREANGCKPWLKYLHCTDIRQHVPLCARSRERFRYWPSVIHHDRRTRVIKIARLSHFWQRCIKTAERHKPCRGVGGQPAFRTNKMSTWSHLQIKQATNAAALYSARRETCHVACLVNPADLLRKLISFVWCTAF